ncbi:FAD binding domain-containing protein [Desulfatirhabdium butyrativorans]|uniref:FAD binding domain-containing protein n=1 Tax=Desulfatirhabdium butyrativorans TaxID=340467 RepID=UPI000407E103|nr:FAD binding domain-containing protein [Desulfatirhabdium butyrativorans]
MRPIFSPQSLPELFSIRNAHPDARLMAGGTDLLVRLRKQPADDRPLILLERIEALQRIETADTEIVIGAGVCFSRIATGECATTEIGVLAQAAATIGGPALRNMATIGGNVCTASPAGDSLPALYVLDASVELASAQGTRIMPVGEFISGPGKTQLGENEILLAIHIPRKRPAWTIQRYEKIGKRKSLAIAVASMAAALHLDENGIVHEARLAWGSVGPTVMRCPEAEEALLGRRLAADAIEAAAAFVPGSVRPIDDIRATAAYRRRVCANLLLRLLDS